MTKIFLDDMRDPPGAYANWIVLRSFFELVGFVSLNGLSKITHLSFDHDLGESYGREVSNGYHCALWLTKIDANSNDPKDAGRNRFAINFSYRLHSSNPTGKLNIKQLLDRHFEREYGENMSREVRISPRGTKISEKLLVHRR